MKKIKPFRVFCCSDTHGTVPPVADDRSKIAAYIHAGDVYEKAESIAVDEGDEAANAILYPELARLRAWVVNAGRPVYAVRGNHDAADPARFFEDALDITGRIVRAAEHIVIAGIGWARRYSSDLPGETEIADVCGQVQKQLSAESDPKGAIILVSHYPARLAHFTSAAGAEAAGQRFDCINRLIEQITPAAVIFGHEHAWFGQSCQIQVRDRWVLVCNPGPTGCILEVDGRECRIIKAASGKV